MGGPASFVTSASRNSTNTFSAAQTFSAAVTMSSTCAVTGALTVTAGITGNTSLTVAPSVLTSGVRTALTVTGAADTGRTLSTEQSDVYINLGRTVTWATGALTTQRSVRVAAPTLAFVGASTVTTAVTLDIDNAPQAGANATITNAYALRVAAGAVLLSGSVGVGGAPDSKAALTVTSTTQGFLPPRMTGTQRDAISSPTAGLCVYNSTTNKLNFYNGSAWEVVTSA